MLKKLKRLLGILTDLLLVGRENGWWDAEGNYHPYPPKEDKELH